MTAYQYTVDADGTFPNRRVDVPRFEKEIRESSITIALDSLLVVGRNCVTTFKTDLPEAEILALEQLVFAHSGLPLPAPLSKVQVFTTENSPAPASADGKPFVLPNIFPSEVLLNFTGAGDSGTVRFAGDLFGVEKAGVGEADQTISFLDGVFLAGGHVSWEGGALNSYVTMDLRAPATTTKAPAVANQGNCNKMATGLGFNVIVPAAGNGEFDLDAPVPVPSTDTETDAPTGWWNYSEPWVGKGTMSFTGTATCKFNLFDVELPLARFAKLHLLSPAGSRDLAASAIKPKWLLPEWRTKVTIHNADAGKTLQVAFDLLIARRKSV